jgi:hypothetical protein
MIVARHEVPGVVTKIARPSGTIERNLGLDYTPTYLSTGNLASLKRHELRFDDKYA